MWLIVVISLLVPLVPVLISGMACVQFLGPGPLRWAWARRVFKRRNWPTPMHRSESRLARRVMYPMRAVQGLPWSLQRAVYWRVRRFPDRRFRRSAWRAGFIGLICIGGVVGLVVWTGMRDVLGGLMPTSLSRKYEASWVPFGLFLLWLPMMMSPLVIGVVAAVWIQREAARDAIARYVRSRPTACDRCGYPLDESYATGHVLRCPECGLRHDLRVRGLALPTTRMRVGPSPEDGPMLVSARRAARLARREPRLRDVGVERAARVIEHAMWEERHGIVLGRLMHAVISSALATMIVWWMWPLIDGALGEYQRGGVTGSSTLSAALASVGPIAGAGLWMWLDRRMLRGVVRRGVERRGVTGVAVLPTVHER